MVRRILIETDVEEDAGGLVKEIINMVMERIDPNVEFTIRQEIIPEKISRGIQIPDFVKGGVRDGKANY
ncbi:MAG: hypothetical protein NC412_09890 [Roseburia sp.]|nr:hypothetical protein [Roseburia sp.]